MTHDRLSRNYAHLPIEVIRTRVSFGYVSISKPGTDCTLNENTDSIQSASCPIQSTRPNRLQTSPCVPRKTRTPDHRQWLLVQSVALAVCSWSKSCRVHVYIWLKRAIAQPLLFSLPLVLVCTFDRRTTKCRGVYVRALISGRLEQLS